MGYMKPAHYGKHYKGNVGKQNPEFYVDVTIHLCPRPTTGLFCI